VLDVDVAASFVEGVVTGCKISNCALVGGETAEMPGLLLNNEYDGVGVAMGAVKNGKTILPDKESMVEGDVLLGLASSGVHSNGFSLVRKILERKRLSLTDMCPWDHSKSTGASLLTPTRIYVVPLLQVVRKDLVKGMSHITGGGLTENVPRMLPKHLAAEIDVASWTRPKVFDWLQASGKCSLEEMARTFNNGVGMVLAVSEVASGEVIRELERAGETVHRIGHLVTRPEDSDGCLLKNLESWGGFI
jgi:phosphoribosylaminoimidazole synthetase